MRGLYQGGCTDECPICQIVLTGTAEERNSHAEACLVAGVRKIEAFI